MPAAPGSARGRQVPTAHVRPLAQGIIVITDDEDGDLSETGAESPVNEVEEKPMLGDAGAGPFSTLRGMDEVPRVMADAVARCAAWIRRQLAARKQPSQGAKFTSRSSMCPLCTGGFLPGDIMVLSYLDGGGAKPEWVHNKCVEELLSSRIRHA